MGPGNSITAYKKLRVRLAFRQVLLLFVLSLPHRNGEMKAGTLADFRYYPYSSTMDLTILLHTDNPIPNPEVPQKSVGV